MRASTLPVALDLELIRNAASTFEFVFQYPGTAALPIDISLDEVRFTVRDAKGGTQKFYKASTSGAHTDGPNGRCTFTFTAADLTIAGALATETLLWVYEVRRYLTGPSGTQYVWFQGGFILHPPVVVGTGTPAAP